jgi:hypothetical protein
MATPENALMVWKADGDPASGSVIFGEMTKSRNWIYPINRLEPGFYSAALSANKSSVLIDIPETIVVLSDDELRLFMEDEADDEEIYSRLITYKGAGSLIKEILEETIPSYTIKGEAIVNTTGVIPDALISWILSSLLTEVQMLEAFGLKSITVSVEGMESDRGLRGHFWRTEDEIEIMISGLTEEEHSPAAALFFEDEMGFGARLRCARDLEVGISSKLNGNFCCEVSVKAPGRHFLDFAVGTEGRAETQRFREIVLRRPLLQAMELVKYSDEGSGSNIVFRLRSDQSNAMAQDQFGCAVLEWFEGSEGPLIMSEINVEEGSELNIYRSAREFVEHRPWFLSENHKSNNVV